MQIKTIRKICRNVIDNWADSFDDIILKSEVKSSCIITGGAIASMLLQEKINDFDIYFNDKNIAERVVQYYINKFNKRETADIDIGDVCDDRIVIDIHAEGIVKAEKQGKLKKYDVAAITNNAISLKGKIQIINRFIGNAKEIHKNFDFVHTTCWYDYSSNELHANEDALLSMMSKTLHYRGSLYPICSILRTKKFIKRGWSINAGQYLKMCLQLHDLDLHNIAVLKDQLIGVDSAYFIKIVHSISKVKEQQDNISTERICDIIDEIFDDLDLQD